jgi:hypothetical protein
MKRRSQLHTTPVRSGDLERDLTPKQFELIGRVAMAYNEAELLVQYIYGTCFGASASLTDDFISRTNGLDSTVLLAKKAICEFQSHPELHNEFSLSLDAFSDLKTYRDAVIHAHIFHVPSGIGRGNLRKGARLEVLLTEKALRGLYDKLVCLRDELTQLLMVVIGLHVIHMAYRFSPQLVAQRKKHIEPMIRAFVPRYRGCRARRLSLEPHPEVPDLPEAQQGLDIRKAISELLDTMAKELGVADYHNPLREIPQKPAPSSGGQ